MAPRGTPSLLLAVFVATLAPAEARAQRPGTAIAPTPVPRTPLTPIAPKQRPGVRIVVVTRNSLGKVFCAMWRGSDGYPTRRKKAAREGVDRRLRVDRAVITFDDVEPGEYAIACFHDENANNDLDTNFLGIPVEGTGASNDAHGFMGPPAYDDARFEVVDHRLTRVTVPMRYMF